VWSARQKASSARRHDGGLGHGQSTSGAGVGHDR
jgi:hypothetical protein